MLRRWNSVPLLPLQATRPQPYRRWDGKSDWNQDKTFSMNNDGQRREIGQSASLSLPYTTSRHDCAVAPTASSPDNFAHDRRADSGIVTAPMIDIMGEIGLTDEGREFTLPNSHWHPGQHNGYLGYFIDSDAIDCSHLKAFAHGPFRIFIRAEHAAFHMTPPPPNPTHRRSTNTTNRTDYASAKRSFYEKLRDATLFTVLGSSSPVTYDACSQSVYQRDPTSALFELCKADSNRNSGIDLDSQYSLDSTSPTTPSVSELSSEYSFTLPSPSTLYVNEPPANQRSQFFDPTPSSTPNNGGIIIEFANISDDHIFHFENSIGPMSTTSVSSCTISETLNTNRNGVRGAAKNIRTREMFDRNRVPNAMVSLEQSTSICPFSLADPTATPFTGGMLVSGPAVGKTSPVVIMPSLRYDRPNSTPGSHSRVSKDIRHYGSGRKNGDGWGGRDGDQTWAIRG